ncbi:MAG: ComEC/Rec2 family competence protein [Actinomycetota bacterium]|nr:ComEC/Rec2 family competence protein [Actinomycetota bacterium]
MAIVLGAALLLGRRAGVPLRASVILAAGTLAGFVVLARPQPSVVRAACMGAVGLVALASGRTRAGVPALSAAVLVLVLVDPTLARSYGFALSVVATAALLLLAPRWSAAFRRRGCPRILADALAVPLAAQAACSPIVVLLSEQVSLAAVPANLLAAPAVAPATVLGVLTAVVATVSPGAAALVARLAGLPVAWIVAVARRAADLPLASVPWLGGVAGAALLAVVVIAAILVGRRVDRVPRGPSHARRLLTLVVAAGCGLTGARLVRPDAAWPPPGWSLVACDVGQGDALVLNAGHGSAVVVDAGPDADAVDACLRDLDVSRVAVVVLTHLHADHVDGLPGVLAHRPVGELLVGPLDEPAAHAAEVRRLCREGGIPVRRVVPGESGSAGPVSWRVTWPRRVIRGEGSDPNNASVVLDVTTAEGTRMLLAGDVEPAAQRAILAAGADAVDVVKVAHHGSRHQDPEWVRALRPRVALLSAGEGNDYGHPAPVTLDLLASTGAVLGRTDRDGDVAIVGPPTALRLVRRGR